MDSGMYSKEAQSDSRSVIEKNQSIKDSKAQWKKFKVGDYVLYKFSQCKSTEFEDR
jgi:hypothetical protein